MRNAVVGIGNELRGDDALGCEVARRLLPIAQDHPDWLIIDAGPVPENFSGVLRRFAPQRIFLVDAALMGEPPGAIRLIDWRCAASPASFEGSTRSDRPATCSSNPNLSTSQPVDKPAAEGAQLTAWQAAEAPPGAIGFSVSTHGLPLAQFAGYLSGELGCEVVLIGVQPGGNALDAPLTPAVQAARDELVREFARLIAAG